MPDGSGGIASHFCAINDNAHAMICIPVCALTESELRESLNRAAVDGDLVEIRLDCLDADEFESLSGRLSDLIRNVDRPTIITFRPAEQGGRSDLDRELRRLFWLCNESSADDYFDIEYDLAGDHSSLDFADSGDWSRTICSYHNFTGVPEGLDQIFESMCQSPARIIKIAIQANDITDCLPIFCLLQRASEVKREIIAIAMGDAGVITRILGPSRGSFLTYGALAEGSGTAPGQLTAHALRNTYRIDKITNETQIFGLVGLPTGHSISPHVHNAAFEATGIDAVYLPFEVRDLESFMRRMVDARSREFDWQLRGLSVTAPHKSAVINYLDSVDPVAKEIGAVNTMVVSSEGLKGYNTDAEGFLKPLTSRLGSLKGTRCAILGAGGAARTIAWVLKREEAQTTIFAREAEKARLLAEEFGQQFEQLVDARFNQFDVVVNATPLGTAGPLEQQTVVKSAQLRGARLVYDLVYNPKETQLMREARDAGCETLSGAAMLVTQAAAQFRLWTGIEPPLEVMTQAAEKALDQMSDKLL